MRSATIIKTLVVTIVLIAIGNFIWFMLGGDGAIDHFWYATLGAGAMAIMVECAPKHDHDAVDDAGDTHARIPGHLMADAHEPVDAGRQLEQIDELNRRLVPVAMVDSEAIPAHWCRPGDPLPDRSEVKKS